MNMWKTIFRSNMVMMDISQADQQCHVFHLSQRIFTGHYDLVIAKHYIEQMDMNIHTLVKS